MCEQTEVEYLPNEVVWVKLRQPALWWPGQVQDFDTLPEEVKEGLRKKPLAIVKFFQEDAYEYVNSLNNIYRYNCSKKHEFIKKGLELSRSKRPEKPAQIDLFPQDVATAETLTDGDPDIIRDDSFAPEEKRSYGALFGNEKKKALKKSRTVVESILKDRPAWRVKPLLGRHSTSPMTPSPGKSSKVITHRRFINKALSGESDYKIYIREQPIVEDETASPSDEYRCHSCDFVTKRLNVIVLHYRSHSKTVTPEPVRTKSVKVKSSRSSAKPRTEKKSETPTKSSPTEPPKKRILKDKEKETETWPSPVDKVDKFSPKKSPKTQAPKRKAKTESRPESDEKKVKKEEIQELLKDWSDEELESESQDAQRYSDGEDGKNGTEMDVDQPGTPADKTVTPEETPVIPEEKPAIPEEKPAIPEDKPAIPEDKPAIPEEKPAIPEEKRVAPERPATPAEDGEVKVEEVDKKSKVQVTVPRSKAVFDFDDSDDGLDPALTHNTRVIGRKLPRVIDNIKERRSSFPEGGSAVKSPAESDGPSEAKKKKKSPTVAVESGEEMDVSVIADEALKKEPVDFAERQKEIEDISAEIDSLLEKTAVPELPAIPKLSNFSFDTTDEDHPLPDKNEEEKESKDKSILREHNDIASNNLQDGVEDGAQTEDPSKNSMPEVGSAVEKDSTPPQANPLTNTAELATKRDKVTKAVITSVVLTAPQSTSGGDHSYVSDKAPPKMPPLIATSQPKLAKSQHTFYISGKSAVKTPPSRRLEEANVVRVVSIAPTSTVTTKPISSFVQKDGKYLLVRSTQPGDRKVMPSLTSVTSPKLHLTHLTVPSSKVGSPQAPTTSPNPAITKTGVPPKLSLTKPSVSSPSILTQHGKKLVILTKKSSGDYLIGPQKQANILTKDVSSPKVTPSVIVSASAPPKLTESKTVVQSPLAPKKNIVISSPGGVRDAKTILVPVSSVNSKTPTVFTTRSPTGSKSYIIPKNVKLVSSKDTPGKVVLQMDSQEKKVTFPPMQRTGNQVKFVSRNVSQAGPSPAQKITSPAPSQSTPTTVPKPAKQNKFFHRDSPPTAKTVAHPVRKLLKRTPLLLNKSSAPEMKRTVAPPLMPTKPSILQSSSRSSIKRNVAPKVTAPPRDTSAVVNETKPETVAASTPPPETVAPEPQIEPASVMATPPEGTVETGAAIMYILDNGTVISYDQVNQVDNQTRTVFIDPASLTPSSGELGNLIFTFDESAGNQGTMLNITQPTESAETAEFSRPPRSTTQDILAEALANTQVLQAEASASELLPANTIPPSSALYPSNVLTLSNNVLETSLTLNQPIMTPLEVPSAVSSLQPPPVSAGPLELPVTIAQPDITISTSSYASLPIPSATIQGSVFSDASNQAFSTIVAESGKQTFYVEAADPGGSFSVAEGTTVFACGDQVIGNAGVALLEGGGESAASQVDKAESGPEG